MNRAGEEPFRSARLALVLLAGLLLAGCSAETGAGGAGSPAGEGPTAPAPNAGAERTGGLTTVQYAPPEETTAVAGGPEDFEVVLRLEGRAGTRFAGSCETGGASRKIEGVVPRRFVLDTAGLGLECDLTKAGRGGTLRAILLAGGLTRSVQQSGPGGDIEISFDPARNPGRVPVE